MDRSPIRLSLTAALLILALAGACASAPASPSPADSTTTPTPRATATASHRMMPTDAPAASASPGSTSSTVDSSATPYQTTAPAATPLPSATSVPTIEGVWASEPITREMIATAVGRHGASSAETDHLVGAHAFVDYIVYELVVTATDWKLNEVPDGLPWGSWNNRYHMPDPTTVVVADGYGRCQLTFGLDFAGVDVAISATDDSCGPTDLLTHVATFEAAVFHRVEGPGAPQAEVETPGRPATGGGAGAPSMRMRPLGSVDGAPMGYLEYLPPGSGNHSSPLLVALHGSGQSGAGNVASLGELYELGIPLLIRNGSWPDNRPFIVLAPQHNVRSPAVCVTSDEIAAFFDFALAHYDVDPSRVYLTGLSCGAIGAWNYLGQHLNERVAAAVLIAGGGYGPMSAAGCALAGVPIWAFHGALDEVVPVRYDINSIARLQGCTNPPPLDARLTVYPQADHDSWTRTYDLSGGYDIYGWLLDQIK